MGCDIHAYIEVKNPDTDGWEFLSLYKKADGEVKPIDFYDGRDYILFGKLAGVRAIGVDPIAPRRGLPESLSEEVKTFYNEGEGYFHSETWYDFAELRAAAGYNQEMYKHLFDEIVGYFEGLDADAITDTEEYITEMLREERDNMERLREFVADIERVLDAYWFFNTDPGQIRIIMWFDN